MVTLAPTFRLALALLAVTFASAAPPRSATPSPGPPAVSGPAVPFHGGGHQPDALVGSQGPAAVALFARLVGPVRFNAVLQHVLSAPTGVGAGSFSAPSPPAGAVADAAGVGGPGTARSCIYYWGCYSFGSGFCQGIFCFEVLQCGPFGSYRYWWKFGCDELPDYPWGTSLYPW